MVVRNEWGGKSKKAPIRVDVCVILRRISGYLDTSFAAKLYLSLYVVRENRPIYLSLVLSNLRLLHPYECRVLNVKTLG